VNGMSCPAYIRRIVHELEAGLDLNTHLVERKWVAKWREFRWMWHWPIKAYENSRGEWCKNASRVMRDAGYHQLAGRVTDRAERVILTTGAHECGNPPQYIRIIWTLRKSDFAPRG